MQNDNFVSDVSVSYIFDVEKDRMYIVFSNFPNNSAAWLAAVKHFGVDISTAKWTCDWRAKGWNELRLKKFEESPQEMFKGEMFKGLFVESDWTHVLTSTEIMKMFQGQEKYLQWDELTNTFKMVL